MTTTLISGERWGENLEATRAYFLSEAERPLSELRLKLDAAQAEFRAAMEGISDAQAQFTPAAGEGEDAWGIAEVLRHIATVEPVMAQRVRLLATGQSTDGLARTGSGSVAGIESRKMDELRQALDRSRSELQSAIAAIKGNERLHTVAAHRRFGELNCRGWVALHTLHLRDHARQISRIQQLPGFPTG